MTPPSKARLMDLAALRRGGGLYTPQSERDACGVGMVAQLSGNPSHRIVQQGLEVLENLAHRGACGCEPNTGDGAGILVQIPHGFFSRECARLGIDLPRPGDYGVGMVFLPDNVNQRNRCIELIEQVVRAEGQQILGWRDVPFDNSDLGPTARSAEPTIRQIFVGRSDDLDDLGDPLAFERKLYVIRRVIEQRVRAEAARGLRQSGYFYIPSLSSRTVVYKGMLTSEQVRPYYPDLSEDDFESALAMVHSRFSTNTFPSWELAQPFRTLSHNGEINTLRGNINWMRARESLLQSDLFGGDMPKLLPLLKDGASDSAILDQALELLVLGGRPLPHAMMMLIPEAYEGHAEMPKYKKDFYEYHSCLMEPWDGPASISFTDGRYIGAVLDRNGLRPSRWLVTRDGLVVMASETGVLQIEPERIERKGRLQPGRMFLVDLDEHRIISDDELKRTICQERPYGQWLRKNFHHVDRLPAVMDIPESDPAQVKLHQRAFGYTHEDLDILIGPAAAKGKEPLGSMGTDTPLAVLSDRPRVLFDYFKQLFAQVTNPPLDAIREEVVTSSRVMLGPEGNLLVPKPDACRQIRLDNPILSDEQLVRLRRLPVHGAPFRAMSLPMLFPRDGGEEGLREAMKELCARAADAIDQGYDILVLSDWNVDEDNVAIPSLLATAGVHHHLVRQGTRTRAGLVIESGEPREPHHFCLLLGYGAAAINPFLALETIRQLATQGRLGDLTPDQACERYREAMRKSIVKVMSKMGISTIQSYCGAQIFEALGLQRDLVDEYFTNTVSRIEGIGLEEIAAEAQARHDKAFPKGNVVTPHLDWGGEYQWRRDGEAHLNNPDSIAHLQHAARSGSYKLYKRYAEDINDQTKHRMTLRGLFQLRFRRNPIPIDEVEPASEIVKRFKTGAMSFGSISAEAHETLAIAMNRIGGRSNSGEGGEDPRRYQRDDNGDYRRSAIHQVASGRFGVTSEYLVECDELQIKMAQGAKPGEGGQLPGHKVDRTIARVRHSTPGVGLISPPPHHDIYSIEDLAQLIFDLKNANDRARINVKLVAETGVGTVAAGVAKAHADVILISGLDGGTGASPLTSLKHAGIPWELGLSEAHQVLVMNDLRSRVTLETDGQLKTGRDMVIAALLGAEEYGFATAALIAAGCIMMRVCHLNTCPVGIATQDPRLRAKYAGKPEHVVNFFHFVAEEARELMAQLGFRTINEMIGRTDRIDVDRAQTHWKARGLDLSPILVRPHADADVGVYKQMEQDHGFDKALDRQLIEQCAPALERGEKVTLPVPIRNINRTVGTMLGSEVTRRYGRDGLPADTIVLNCSGTAGQSFGAFIPAGMTMRVEGDANDYFGKGLSGGRLVLYPPRTATFTASENIICGNVAFYGATGGRAFIRGLAGERFCVRNSGVEAVVEGIGDHGCEYMTGGRVIVLGATGRNFGAGMSGGIAYILDESGDFKIRCNPEMVELEPFDTPEDRDYVKGMIERHVRHTGSNRGRAILEKWDKACEQFVKVMPTDYKRVLAEQPNPPLQVVASN